MPQLHRIGDQLMPLLRVARRINEQRDVATLAQTIVAEARALCRAEAGALWLYRGGGGDERLVCMIRQGEGGTGVTDGVEVPLARSGCPVARVAKEGETLLLASGQGLAEEDRALWVPDLVTEVSAQLLVPLPNHDGEVVGVVQLINARDDQGHRLAFSRRQRVVAEALAGYAGIALNNLLVVAEMKDLLDAFVKVIAQAIDAKSPHTSAHCQRVPLLTELLARAACQDHGTFADFDLDEDGWYELRVAAWLHDCGKLATPDSVLEKSTKLHALHDRIDMIAARFAVLRAELVADFAERERTEPERASALAAERERALAELEADLALLQRVNLGGETMAREDQERVRAMARRTWTNAQGQLQPLLSEDEVSNLCIPKGTLTEDERAVINGHMDVTLAMLESLPFPRKLRRVPEYAGGHHERMDGTGFPRGLTREQMSIPARIMAIADIFEALTSRERPYKPPLKLSEALAIMRQMRDDHHLDPDLYRLFLDAGVWRQYALEALDPEQRDVEEVSKYR